MWVRIPLPAPRAATIRAGCDHHDSGVPPTGVHGGVQFPRREAAKAWRRTAHHYELALRIGELSLGEDFDGLLLWGLIDIPPFLRCMSDFVQSLWRLSRFDEAGCIVERMLWLNPGHNQGVRFFIDDVRAWRAWNEAGEHR